MVFEERPLVLLLSSAVTILQGPTNKLPLPLRGDDTEGQTVDAINRLTVTIGNLNFNFASQVNTVAWSSPDTSLTIALPQSTYKRIFKMSLIEIEIINLEYKISNESEAKNELQIQFAWTGDNGATIYESDIVRLTPGSPIGSVLLPFVNSNDQVELHDVNIRIAESDRVRLQGLLTTVKDTLSNTPQVANVVSTFAPELVSTLQGTERPVGDISTVIQFFASTTDTIRLVTNPEVIQRIQQNQNDSSPSLRPWNAFSGSAIFYWSRNAGTSTNGEFTSLRPIRPIGPIGNNRYKLITGQLITGL